MYPALFVHLWLVVFVVALLGARLGYMMLRAVEWAEWLLKRGEQHPFKAIGVIGAALAFIVVGLGKNLSHLL
jgi:prolipoprotein diacylglyceryltransferase